MTKLQQWFMEADALLAEIERADRKAKVERARNIKFHAGCQHGRKAKVAK